MAEKLATKVVRKVVCIHIHFILSKRVPSSFRGIAGTAAFTLTPLAVTNRLHHPLSWPILTTCSALESLKPRPSVVFCLLSSPVIQSAKEGGHSSLARSPGPRLFPLSTLPPLPHRTAADPPRAMCGGRPADGFRSVRCWPAP